MRDIDLFVSVASIGSDPTWNDGGPAGPFRVYWLDFVEQDLTASAKVRQELIKELIPRMGRSDTWHIDGNHLVVDGKHHRYRIHLGSGAVSIDPGRYLRIEPQNQRKTQQQDRIWLPFHGDQILSTVLSKALLLSNDDDLPDPTILGDNP